MRFLVLYYNRPGLFTYEHLHQNWLKRLGEVEDVVFYGPGMAEEYGLHKCTRFQPERNIADIVKTHKIDIVIIYTKDRMFYRYYPESLYPSSGKNDQWLHPSVRDAGVPIVCIENDYHYESDDRWHIDHNITLIMQRHLCNVRDESIPQVWLPFATDISIFRPINTQRVAGICMIGAMSGVYYFRRKASEILQRSTNIYHRMDSYIRDEYPNILRTYEGYLCGSSKYRISAGKVFEIMASGGVLFTDKFPGLDILFPKGSYVTYEDDFRDLVAKAKFIASHPKENRIITAKAVKCIEQQHTYDHRIHDFLEILKMAF